VQGSERDDTAGERLGLPPSTVPPPSVRAAILARVVEQSVGGGEAPLLDGRYRLLQEIGRGGAGTVWKAELLPLGRLVAVKLLRSGVASNRKAVSRLVREAMMVSKLGHENIVRVDDVGIDEHGSAYIAMELLRGESLAQWVDRCGPMPWSDVAEIATQICSALSAAHAVGVVHRDLKPANVFADRGDDKRWRCTLLDFGLCTGGRGTPLPLTEAGVLLGTPGYAAPEQIRGEVVDGRADLYGLACVMVELLTGRSAFEGENRQALIAAQLDGRRRDDLDTLELSPDVVALLDRALSTHAEQRPADPAAFAEAIASVRERPTREARGDAPTASPVRRMVLGVAGFVALAAVGAGAVVSWRMRGEASDPTVRAPVRVSVAEAPVAVSPPPPSPTEVVTSVPKPEVSPPSPKPDAVTVEPRPRAKRARRRSSKPAAKAKPEAALPKREYPEGIRDPFAGH